MDTNGQEDRVSASEEEINVQCNNHLTVGGDSGGEEDGVDSKESESRDNEQPQQQLQQVQQQVEEDGDGEVVGCMPSMLSRPVPEERIYYMVCGGC